MECLIDNSGMVVYTMVWFYTHDAEEALFISKQVQYVTIFLLYSQCGGTNYKYTSMECIKYSLYQLWYKLVVPALVKHSKS